MVNMAAHTHSLLLVQKYKIGGGKPSILAVNPPDSVAMVTDGVNPLGLFQPDNRDPEMLWTFWEYQSSGDVC